MKKAIVIPVLLVLFGVGAYLSPRFFAQAPERSAPSIKVAVVNVRAVLKENVRAKALQAELEEAIKPHRISAERLSKEIDAMKLGADALAKKKAEWEVVNADILRLIEEKHKEKMPGVWQDVNLAIDAAAKAYGFQIVLGYGDPENPDLSAFQGAKGSKLRTIDMGCTVPLYIHGSVDITDAVIAMLKAAGPGGRK